MLMVRGSVAWWQTVTIEWLSKVKSLLTQREVINGVPLGSPLSPMLFNTVNDQDAILGYIDTSITSRSQSSTIYLDVFNWRCQELNLGAFFMQSVYSTTEQWATFISLFPTCCPRSKKYFIFWGFFLSMLTKKLSYMVSVFGLCFLHWSFEDLSQVSK